MSGQDTEKTFKTETPPVVLPEPGSLVVSSSPHVQAGGSISAIMGKVIICLLPAMASGVIFFGLPALEVILLCTGFCVLFELAWCLITRTPVTIFDLSSALTGIILALNLPPSVPWWICLVGSFVAIIVAKEVFGGLGQNPFNPAAVARISLLVGFAGPMTVWSKPSCEFICSQPDLVTGATSHAVVTCATPLSVAKLACTEEAISALETPEALWNGFIGYTGGSIGETSAVAILIGAFGLLCFRLIRWQIPFAMLSTVFVFTWIVNLANPALTPGPLFHLLSGGMLIGAFFMATDMVTSPVSRTGAVIFGCAIGLIACVIRIWGSYPEGVSFAIVIMNALVPIIDRLCYKRPFGWNATSASMIQVRRGEIK